MYLKWCGKWLAYKKTQEGSKSSTKKKKEG